MHVASFLLSVKAGLLRCKWLQCFRLDATQAMHIALHVMRFYAGRCVTNCLADIFAGGGFLKASILYRIAGARWWLKTRALRALTAIVV
jgi:hypothetical protein